MESALLDILALLKAGKNVDETVVERVCRRANRGRTGGRRLSKRMLLPFYLRVREDDPDRWRTWEVTPELERALLRALQMKPRRTASGVATVTVLTKPWPCSGTCIYCPSDLRMPKSYLHDEPACQRAERNYFDPYLQVTSRIRALDQMGHPTDKIELIVLGGTWDDYPRDYRVWFVKELFRALNDGAAAEDEARKVRGFYRSCGIDGRPEACASRVERLQRAVDAGRTELSGALEELYGKDSPWEAVSRLQTAGLDELAREHARGERASRRVVGLSVETRPDAVTCESLRFARRLGCTKLQMGVQSLNPDVVARNGRPTEPAVLERAFRLQRLFGFKIQVHAMVNLLGSSPERDRADFARLVGDRRFMPDEVKLYPCSLVAGTELQRRYEDGSWQPYLDDVLLDVLACDLAATPCFTRISRMIRDISSTDIVAGNKTTNLRQLVEREVDERGVDVQEMRYREVATDEVSVSELRLQVVPYRTSCTDELFCQWVTDQGRIAGFLRLSLPDAHAVTDGRQGRLPVGLGGAMIREVHVYGRAEQLHVSGDGTQHLGLGRRLVETACAIARTCGYTHLNVISSVGTRAYYRRLGFEDGELYQRRAL